MKEIKQNGEILYKCEECGLAYTDKSIAEQCEAWCKENHSCNLDIIKHANKTNSAN